jgi:hypothetical protein
MEKHCKYCNNTKAYNEFNKSSVHKDGYNSKCKTCSNEYLAKFRANRCQKKNKQRMKAEYAKRKDKVKAYFQNRKDGLHYVYILQKENYAGVTDCPPTRKTGHKSLGRYIDDMRLIYSTPDREEAEELEALLHDIGYGGKHQGRKPNYT